MPADATDLAIPPHSPLTGLSSLIGTVARVIGDSVLVARSFRDHPTQLIQAPDRASFIVEVKATRGLEPELERNRREPHRQEPPRPWTVEVSAPGADGLGPVVLLERYRTMSRATRRARAVRRRIRRGDFFVDE